MELYNIIRRTGDFIGSGIIGVLGVDAIRNAFIGGEQNYQIASFEAVVALGISLSKYCRKETEERLEKYIEDVNKTHSHALAISAKWNQISTEWSNELNNFRDYLDSEFDNENI